jgi:hypothetical protein
MLPDAAGGRPSRRVFALSPAGHAELDRWLAEPVAHTREIRLEFLVKLYFALVLDPHLAVRLVAEQREMCARLIDSLAQQMGAAHLAGGEDSRERWFGNMVVDMRLAQTRAALAWLERVGRDAEAAASRDGE